MTGRGANPAQRADLPANLVAAPDDYGQALLALVGSPNQSSRRWVYRTI